jgi:eukaryotic-like serine/threonine-protein kinase
MADMHINVGLAALSRGIITLEAFAKVMETYALGTDKTLRDLWVAPGLMTEAQFGSILELLTRRRPSTDSEPLSSNPSDIPSLRMRPPSKPEELSTKVGRRSANNISSLPATAPTAASIVHDDPDKTLPPPMGSELQFKLMPDGTGGELLAGRYRKVSMLGKGGLGEVMACDDTVLQRTVAVKAGHQTGEIDQYSTKVILAREARIISCLEHPNIIPIYDAGVDPKRGPFYVMRQVTDTSLEMILHQRKMGEGNPHDYTLNRLLRYFLQVCNAVDYAHHRSVIHCDIKPANILLGDYGEVLLVDWGLAQSRNHPLGVRGGTLGYMAPEQMDPLVDRLDWRTDVFALGAIIYEILCGVPAFEEARRSDLSQIKHSPSKLYKRPPLPSSRDSRLEIPKEVEDTCMRAIAVDRDQRVETVRELAVAIEEWIEGSKQKERQRIEADKSADAGDELAERYHEFVESRPEKLTVFRALRADVAPWASPDDKQDLWDAEDIIKVTDALQVRTFHSAVSAYERALDAVPNHTRARRGLARLYYAELQRARQRGNELDLVAYEQLLREVDDGTFVRELQRDGVLELRIGPHAERVMLGKLVERERRLVEGASEQVAEKSLARRSLPAGRYVVTAHIGDTGTVAWPVSIDPGTLCRIEIDPPAPEMLADSEVVVPGGPVRIGGDPLSTESEELVIVDLPTFVMQKFPVTFGDWFVFLDEMLKRDEPSTRKLVPATGSGGLLWELREDGSWHATSTAERVLGGTDPLRIPVFGVSAEAAEHYARWLSGKTGKKWRLPDENEWEKAGRGTDGRIYPWGDHFDATFCKMRDSRPGTPTLEAMGTFEWDTSPYGVRDLAGGVSDWCIPDHRRNAPREPREVVARGGAWCDWAIDCRLTSRRRYLATEHSPRVGVRLVRDL